MRIFTIIFTAFFSMTIISGLKFRRIIEAVGLPYYKILMTLGDCKETLLFSEQLVWGKLNMNRVFDIYYRSSYGKYSVSMVEIELVLTDTDVMAYSENGVGRVEFSASLYLPPRTLVIFYSLKIFTCNRPDLGDISAKYTLGV